MSIAELTAQTAEDVRVLREALAAGPTPGPWSTISRGSYWGEEEADVRDADEQDVAGAEFVQPIGDNDTTRGQLWARDACYIAAAGPDRITRLLDALERERAARQQAQAQLEQAREQLREVREAFVLKCDAYSLARDAADQLMRERDEALEEVKRWVVRSALAETGREQLQRERDQARSQAAPGVSDATG